MTDHDDSPATEASYLERVERHFGSRRNGPVLLSPRDWGLVQEWQRRGLPVEVVMRGINRAFDAFAAALPEHRRINSLSYCRQQVEEAWQEHRDRLATEGLGATGSPLGGAAEHLRRAASSCQAAAAQLPASARDRLQTARERLEQLALAAEEGNMSVHDLDETANALEAELRSGIAGHDVRLPRFSPWA